MFKKEKPFEIASTCGLKAAPAPAPAPAQYTATIKPTQWWKEETPIQIEKRIATERVVATREEWAENEKKMKTEFNADSKIWKIVTSEKTTAAAAAAAETYAKE
jgi:hypothetical protein